MMNRWLYKAAANGDVSPLLVEARFGHLQVVKTLADPNNELPMQDDTTTAGESGTNLRSSHRQRDVEEGLVDHQLEQDVSHPGREDMMDPILYREAKEGDVMYLSARIVRIKRTEEEDLAAGISFE
ncbi:hypothetical protein RHSIM_Rhsim04G0028900 [Rhododendron simsii]|uniref:Uncharacterized protein n=1 Tax=Rhododendron simsii TaxID=118357 RepID=A0A834GXJ2_RHOSS|nr:hypothetical protein RHSIM_Rhsim04G0028900 [Rhododendron simsii]